MATKIFVHEVAAAVITVKREVTRTGRTYRENGHNIGSVVFTPEFGPAYYRGALPHPPNTPAVGYKVEPLFGICKGEDAQRIAKPGTVRLISSMADFERALDGLRDGKRSSISRHAAEVFERSKLIRLTELLKNASPGGENFERALFLVAAEAVVYVMRHKPIADKLPEYFENARALLKLMRKGGAKTAKLRDFADPESSRRPEFAVGYVKPLPIAEVRLPKPAAQPHLPYRRSYPEGAKIFAAGHGVSSIQSQTRMETGPGYVIAPEFPAANAPEMIAVAAGAARLLSGPLTLGNALQKLQAQGKYGDAGNADFETAAAGGDIIAAVVAARKLFDAAPHVASSRSAILTAINFLAEEITETARRRRAAHSQTLNAENFRHNVALLLEERLDGKTNGVPYTLSSLLAVNDRRAFVRKHSAPPAAAVAVPAPADIKPPVVPPAAQAKPVIETSPAPERAMADEPDYYVRRRQMPPRPLPPGGYGYLDPPKPLAPPPRDTTPNWWGKYATAHHYRGEAPEA